MKFNVDNINLKITNIDFWSPNKYNKGGMRIHWDSDIGFGTLDIVKVAVSDGEDFESPYEEMKLNAYTETMDCNEDKSFIRKILSLVADYLNVID